MQNTYNKYQLFSYTILEETPQLLIREQMYLNQHFGTPKCLNLNPSAEIPPSRKGKLVSQETKIKISISLKKVNCISRFKRGTAPWNKGVPCSNKTKRKISNTLKGSIPWSKGKQLWPNHSNPFFGKQHTRSTKEKMSQHSARKGNPGTFKGKKHSEEARKRMSLARKNFLLNN